MTLLLLFGGAPALPVIPVGTRLPALVGISREKLEPLTAISRGKLEPLKGGGRPL